LFHKNVTRAGKDFDDRPFDNLEEMHSIVKDKWNAKVTNGDTVYILGDLAMRGTQEDLIAFVSTLKGHKVMVKGNHDDIKDLRYKQLFDEICDYKEISDTLDGKNVKLVLCHYPILMWKNQHRGSILLYGHVHNSIEEYYFKKCLREMDNEDSFNRRDGEEVLRAYNVGCMMPYMDYEPKSLTEIVASYERFENSVS
jgi:calcineurin-like phosphoesterase family protein